MTESIIAPKNEKIHPSKLIFPYTASDAGSKKIPEPEKKSSRTARERFYEVPLLPAWPLPVAYLSFFRQVNVSGGRSHLAHLERVPCAPKLKWEHAASASSQVRRRDRKRQRPQSFHPGVVEKQHPPPVTRGGRWARHARFKGSRTASSLQRSFVYSPKKSPPEPQNFDRETPGFRSGVMARVSPRT